MLKAEDVKTVSLTKEDAELALLIGSTFALYSNSKLGISTGSETPEQNYRSNNLAAVLSEMALSRFLFGGCHQALLARLMGLYSAKKCGRPNDDGCDLRCSLRDKYKLDMKVRRNREDSTQDPLALNLILRDHELRGADHVYVFSVIDPPEDGREFCAVRDWKVTLVGWAYESDLRRTPAGFYGDWYLPADELRSMDTLDVQATLVKRAA